MKRVGKFLLVMDRCNHSLHPHFSLYRECDHVNLCKFVGACIEVPHMSILCEYSSKGSLSDVLWNEEVPLNWAFRYDT